MLQKRFPEMSCMCRMTILPTVNELEIFLERFREFHARFLSKYTWCDITWCQWSYRDVWTI